jgi:hypothetical protein
VRPQQRKQLARTSDFPRFVAIIGMLALSIGVWTPRTASATFIAETEPNNTGATAQNVDGNFSLDNDPNITSSTTIPHVSIRATGNGTNDFYSFTSAGGIIILDIDTTNAGNDSEIGIWNAAGVLVDNADDLLPPDPGSDLDFSAPDGTFDSFLQLAGQPAGVYTVGVCLFQCAFADGFSMTGGVQGEGDFYTLHISTAAEVTTVPAPGALILLGSGLAGLALISRRRQGNPAK